VAKRARPRPRSSVVRLGLLGIVTFLVVGGGVFVGLSPTSSPAFRVVPVGGPVTETLSVGRLVGYPAPGFWGVNVRVDTSLSSGDASRFNQTPDTWVRWPGGATADGLNITTDQIRNDSGGTYQPPQTAAEFVTWCGWIHCHAIVELPAEINDSHTAAYYVRYFESSLGFRPNFWEIGNEPAAWTHFNVPWTGWSSQDHTNATPFQYAYVVKQYVAAIRAVDVRAKIIGLPGLGTGTAGERAWIQNVVAYNGATIDALAVHTYPAGAGSSNATLATFYASLSGPGSFRMKIPGDRAQILTACPTCTSMQLFSTETSSAVDGGSYDAAMASEAQGVYMMAETIEGLSLNLSNVDYFAYDSSYHGSWFTESRRPSPMLPVFQLYSYLFNNSTWGQTFSASVAPASGSLFTLVERNATHAGRSETLMVSNTDTVTTYSLSLVGSGFPWTHAASVYSWDSSSSAPSVTNFGSGTMPPLFAIPPQGILEVVVA
jgi:hypothetical protein